ncbi:MAG: cytochrome c family protein [Gemmataceae bacterium]|nr:cytochrome c family protein [Gemmataceae bacterium]
MLTSRGLVVVGAMVLVIVGVVWWRRPPVAAPKADDGAPPRLTPATSSSPFAGTASCAGRSCHGSLDAIERATSWQMEYTLWVQHDPHTRAYRTLHEPLAQEIARRLGLPRGAHEAAACLSCHTQPAASGPIQDSVDAASIRRERAAGVGCEACHGTAPRWLDAHLTKEWQTKSAEEKFREHGLVPLGDPAALVKACAGCHVGAPPGNGAPVRDVNHDLIAAGHPRLAFEASAFVANLPPHWKPRPRNENQLWAAGQVVSAAAALELLKHRTTAVWPEFAEYDCTACHHDLQEPTWRRPLGRRGALAWGTWYFSMPRWLAGAAGATGTPALDELKRIMAKPRPARDVAVEKIDAALVELRRLHAPVNAWDGGGPFALGKIQGLLMSDNVTSWDEAEQLYLAFVALNQTAKDTALGERLKSLLDVRALPPGYATPRGDVDPRSIVRRLRE